MKVLLFALLYFTPLTTNANPLCQEVFLPETFLKKNIFFNKLPNFNKKALQKLDSIHYLKVWAFESAFRSYIRHVSPYQKGIPKNKKWLQLHYDNFEEYKNSRYRLMSWRFWKVFTSGQWKENTREAIAQYAIDIRSNPLRFLWSTHDPSQYTHQSQFNKIISWPSHFLIHPLAEITGSYKQLSMLGNLALFSALFGGATYYKTHNHTKDVYLAKELIQKDDRFYNIQNALGHGHIDYQTAVKETLKLNQELESLTTLDAMFELPLWRGMNALQDQGFFTNNTEYIKIASLYFDFFTQKIELKTLKESINKIGEEYSDQEFSILSNFSTYIPSSEQGRVHDYFTQFSEKDPSVKSLVLKKSLTDYAEVKRALLTIDYKDSTQRKNKTRLKSLSKMFNLSSSIMNNLNTKLEKLLVKADTLSWEEDIKELDSLVSSLGLPPQTSFYLMDSFLPDSTLQIPIKIKLSPKREELMQIKTKSDLLAYALTRAKLSSIYNFYGHKKEIWNVRNLIGEIQKTEKIKEIFSSSVPKNTKALLELVSSSKLFEEIQSRTDISSKSKSAIIKKYTMFELYLFHSLDSEKDPIKRQQLEQKLFIKFMRTFKGSPL